MRKIAFEIGAAQAALCYVIDLSSTTDYVLSLTNGAEILVGYLYRNGQIFPHTRLFYRDTDGRVDELLHHEDERGGHFDGFKPGYRNETDFMESHWFKNWEKWRSPALDCNTKFIVGEFTR